MCMFEGTDYSNEPSAAFDDLVAGMYIVDCWGRLGE